MKLESQVQYWKQNNLIEPNDRLVVGVSGGPDSMFLLYLLNALKEQWNLAIHVAHINHHTRDMENEQEQTLIEQFCEDEKLPFFVGNFHYEKIDNFHEEARNYRYTFFKELAKNVQASKIVLAHHEDDQVETMIFRLLRGNSLKGYLGMDEEVMLGENLRIVRPILNLKKEVILSYCDLNRIPYAIDSSNRVDHYTRNYIRHHIIPEFKTIQPDLNRKYDQFHEQLSEAVEFLQENAKNLYQEMIISAEQEKIILDQTIIKGKSKAVLRICLLNLISDFSHHEIEVNFEKMKQILHLIDEGKASGRLNLGKDYYLIKEYQKIILQKGMSESMDYFIPLKENQEVSLPIGVKIVVKIIEEKANLHNKSLILCYNNTIWPLSIRTKKDGDYIKTKIGKKKVNRIFIDAKVPLSLRKTWPLLVTNDGDVLWVVGLQKAEIEINKDSKYILIEVL